MEDPKRNWGGGIKILLANGHESLWRAPVKKVAHWKNKSCVKIGTAPPCASSKMRGAQW